MSKHSHRYREAYFSTLTAGIAPPPSWKQTTPDDDEGDGGDIVFGGVASNGGHRRVLLLLIFIIDDSFSTFQFSPLHYLSLSLSAVDAVFHHGAVVAEGKASPVQHHQKQQLQLGGLRGRNGKGGFLLCLAFMFSTTLSFSFSRACACYSYVEGHTKRAIIRVI